MKIARVFGNLLALAVFSYAINCGPYALALGKSRGTTSTKHTSIFNFANGYSNPPGTTFSRRTLRLPKESQFQALAWPAKQFPSKVHHATHELITPDVGEFVRSEPVPVDVLIQATQKLHDASDRMRLTLTNDTLVISERRFIGWTTHIFRVKRQINARNVTVTIIGPALSSKPKRGYGIVITLATTPSGLHISAVSSETMKRFGRLLCDALITRTKYQLRILDGQQRAVSDVKRAMETVRRQENTRKLEGVFDGKSPSKRTHPLNKSTSANNKRRSTRWESSRMKSMTKGG